ncbi:MAG: TetR/AcrR family transcriptional regulator [Chlamydiales bacterium]
MSRKKNIDDATVLEKALLVISDRGPDSFTLNDIGKAVGLAPATLLQRFGSKQSLLILAAKHAGSQLNQSLKKHKKKQLAWDKELIAILGELPDGFGTRQDIANSLGLLKLDMIDPQLHPIAREHFCKFREKVKTILQQARSKGHLPATEDIEILSWQLDALRHGLVIQWTLNGDGDLQNWLQKGLRNYLQGKKNAL